MCRNLHILTVLLSMLLLFVSCVKEERGRVEAQRAVQIMVSSGIQTKAVEDPTPQETRINSIRVYAFINGVRAGYHHEVFEEDIAASLRTSMLSMSEGLRALMSPPATPSIT